MLLSRGLPAPLGSAPEFSTSLVAQAFLLELPTRKGATKVLSGMFATPYASTVARSVMPTGRSVAPAMGASEQLGQQEDRRRQQGAVPSRPPLLPLHATMERFWKQA